MDLRSPSTPHHSTSEHGASTFEPITPTSTLETPTSEHGTLTSELETPASTPETPTSEPGMSSMEPDTPTSELQTSGSEAQACKSVSTTTCEKPHSPVGFFQSPKIFAIKASPETVCTSPRRLTLKTALPVRRARGQFITPLATLTLLWQKSSRVALVLGISSTHLLSGVKNCHDLQHLSHSNQSRSAASDDRRHRHPRTP